MPRTLIEQARSIAESGGFRHIEIRLGRTWPGEAEDAPPRQFTVSNRFYRHNIDLSCGSEALYRNLHKDSMVRKIRRASREGLTIGRGTGAAEIAQFHHLFLLTRRRHGYFPPPLQWFGNMLAAMGPKASLHLARKPDGEAIAGMVLLRHGRVVYYKYGASDERFHAMGGMPLLFWDAIQQACEGGFTTLDLGRTDLDGTSLMEFKEKLGASRSQIEYWRAPGCVSTRPAVEGVSAAGWVSRDARRWWCAHLPDRVLAWAGAAIYPHIG